MSAKYLVFCDSLQAIGSQSMYNISVEREDCSFVVSGAYSLPIGRNRDTKAKVLILLDHARTSCTANARMQDLQVFGDLMPIL